MTEIVIRTAAAPAAAERAERDRQLSPAARQAVADGIPASTRRAYDSDMTAFARWCAAQGRTPLPATPETVTEYVTHLSTAPSPRTGRPLAPSSIERALAAIRTAHKAADVPAPETKGARKVLSGYRSRLAETHDPAAVQRQAAPAVPTALRAMVAGLDRTTLQGQRDAALILLGFATAARVSELVALDVAAVARTEHGLDVRLYRRKTKAHTVSAVLYGTDPATCPVRAVLAYLDALTAAGRTDGPLFVRIDRHGRIAPPMLRRGVPIGDPAGRLTPEAAADVVARLADTAGLTGEWSGHSLRRGFATAARQAGHDLVRIGRAGGWADGSKALLRYLDEVDRVTGSPLVGIGL